MYAVTQKVQEAFDFNGSTKRGYISLVPLSDEASIIIAEDNLKEINILDDIYTPKEGIIGSTIAKQVTLSLFRPVDFDLIDREFDVYIGVEVDTIPYYVPYGRYLVQRPDNNIVTSKTTTIALDYMVKFNIPYIDDGVYPKTAMELLESICEQSGVDLGTESFANDDFIIESNQFVNGESCRMVLKALAQLSGTYAKIGRDNKLYLSFLNTNAPVLYNKDTYTKNTSVNATYGPINRLVLRMSQVEGENVTIEDSESIALYGVKELTISDNPFLYTQAKRETVIDNIWDIVHNFTYTSYKAKVIARPYMDSGDAIGIEDLNEDISNSYILTNSIKFTGGLSCNISATTETQTESKYIYKPQLSETLRRTEIVVDKALGEINSIAQKTESVIGDVSILKQTVDGFEFTVQNLGGNNLIKNSAMKNGTNFWFAHLLAPYIESDTPPTEELYDGAYWYCSSNYEDYQLGVIYRYESGNWIETTLTRKYIDDAQNLLKYMTQYENDYTRQNTLSNSMIKLDGGTNLDISHIFSCTNPIDIIKGQDYITLSFKLKNSMKTGVGYIALGFTEKYIDNAMAEILYSLYEPCFWFTPDDVKELTKIVLTVKVPQKGDFIEATAGLTAPTTNKMWLDLNTYQLKEYNEETETWERKQTILPCYETTTRQIWAYRQLFDIYYETPVNFDNFEIKCVYPAFTMYPEFMRLIPSDVPPTPFKGAYWLNVVENVYRAKYDGDEFVEWEDTGISTEYIMTHPFPTPPFPTQYGVPLQGYYEVADIKAEWNKVATEWSAYPGEIYGKNVKIDEKGMHIISGQNTMFIDEDEIIAKFNDQPVFIISKDLVQFTKLLLIQQMQMGSYIFESRNINSEEHLLIY